MTVDPKMLCTAEPVTDGDCTVEGSHLVKAPFHTGSDPSGPQQYATVKAENSSIAARLYWKFVFIAGRFA